MSADALTVVMPSFGASPLVTKRMPFMPDSVEPIASVITRWSGSSSVSCSFTVWEKIAAVLENENSDEMSTSPFIFSSASASGRAIASPVTPIMLTRCFSTRRHVSSASNLSTMTAVFPSHVTRKIENCPRRA